MYGNDSKIAACGQIGGTAAARQGFDMPQREAEVSAAMSDLARRLELLQERTNSLVIRLQPALRNEPPNKEEARAIRGYAAPLAAAISDKSEQVSTMIYQIESAIERLEI